MDFDFVIPLSIDALQEASTSRQYVVSYISSAREIPQHLQDCNQNFRKDGPQFILDQNYFDALYSVLVNFKSLDEEIQMRAWELMIKDMTTLSSKITEVSDEKLSSSEQQQWLLTVKMTTYIASNLTEAFERNYNKPTTDTMSIGKKGKRGPKKSNLGVDWEDERSRILLQFFSLLQPPLNRLWDPPVVEEDYVNLIANCCYKILESTTMNLVRTKAARDSIFHIIGTLVKKFNHGLACSLKLMQLLQHFDHLVSPVSQGLILMMENYDTKSVLQEIIREVVKIDSVELAKDSSGLRNYAQFFVEVADKCPQVFIPSLPLLVSLLQQENYSMRNCVLSILGSIVMKVLKSETLDSKCKSLRNECLGFLEEFIHDCNAFVRSRVLQIWQELIEGQAVPLTQQQPILKKVVLRLRDKSTNVRKHALHLMTAFLKANPFAAKLPLEELKKQFEVELQKLEEMRPGSMLSDQEESDTSTFENVWSGHVPAIIKALKKIIRDDSAMESDEEDHNGVDSSDKENGSEFITLKEDFSLNDGVVAVGEALKDAKEERAIAILQKVTETHTDAEVLKYNETEHSLPTAVYGECKTLTVDQKEMFAILHRIFISYLIMKDEEEKIKAVNGENEQDERELKRKEEEFQKQKLLCFYLRDSVNFAREIHKGIPDICQLLSSRQVTDIMEAIQFFVTAFEFGVLNAMAGVRRMLVHVWSKEQNIKEAVINAYRRLYIDTDSQNERSHACNIVRNLTALITGATLGELTSLEEIVAQFVQTDDINRHCITLLWERFTKALPDTTDDESRAALMLLTMAANSQMNIISANLSILIEVGLGDRGRSDFTLVKYVCIALAKLAPSKLKTDDKKPPFRLEQDHEMFKRLSVIVTEGILNIEDTQYSPMAVEAVAAIYLLAEHPDIICGNMLKEMVTKVLQNSKDEDQEDSKDKDQHIGLAVSMPVLSRFLTVVGHIALRQLIHLDTFIFTELKRRNYVREEQEQKQKDKRKSRKRKSLHATSALDSISKGSQDADIDDEMGLTGAVADDMEAEFIRNICETEVVSGDTLLAILRPLIIGVCSNPTKYSDPHLRTAAALTLAKFMLVSSECCEKNLQLLFTILEKSTEQVIRANAIIAVGDLTVRYPNLVEPWTSRIYARLGDESPVVRRNTLTVLTHLILNDQVKVKGQISDIALCLTDEDCRISGLAKLFFNELSKKGNALYNVLPDIISRLSDTESHLQEERFRTIISHIFGLIQKDKQLETFIEKLCYRLQATTVARQWRDITYCLSLLPYTEKGIHKLTESFACFADKLHEQEVYELFLSILANARKQAKAETKTAIEELESRLQECHKKGVDMESIVNEAKTARGSTRKKSGVKKITRRRNRRSSDSESGDDDDDESDNENELHPAHRDFKENVPPNRPRRTTTTRMTKPVFQSSSSESEMEVSEGSVETGNHKSDDDDEGSSDNDFQKETPGKGGRTRTAKRLPSRTPLKPPSRKPLRRKR